MKLSGWLLAGTIAAAICAPARAAECDFELFGDAVQLPGHAVVTSDVTLPNGYGGLVFWPAAGTTFGSLTDLSLDYDLTDDGAGGGSPRIQVGIDQDGNGSTDGNVFIYVGTPPNFTDPGGAGAESTGNLIGSADLRFDTSQVGGPFYNDYAGTLALVGGYDVTYVALVVDGSWTEADGEQTTLVHRFQVDDCVYADTDNDAVPDHADACIPSDLRPFVDVNGAAPGETTIPNVVNAQGCTIQDLVNGLAAGARNHGQYVSGISALANALYQAGAISRSQRQELITGAARSRVGK